MLNLGSAMGMWAPGPSTVLCEMFNHEPYLAELRTPLDGRRTGHFVHAFHGDKLFIHLYGQKDNRSAIDMHELGLALRRAHQALLDALRQIRDTPHLTICTYLLG